mgnify:CR=1 FL=1|tara:strand:- start:598 stop:1047 length:450 start_codon:yes stop_codon:yes gene_type:complete
MDIVRVFETYCTDNNIHFEYGSKAHLNLIEGELDPDKVYLLLFPVNRSKNKNQLNTKLKGKTYNGNFFLLKNGDYTESYFKENGTDVSDSKYAKNIEPLEALHDLIGNYFIGGCGYDFELDVWNNVDAINVLDANKDGLWCTYTIRIDE